MLMILLSACAPHILQATALSGDLQDGHYIVISDDGEVFDCKSRPDGTRWDPTCVLVEFHNGYAEPSKAPEEPAEKR